MTDEQTKPSERRLGDAIPIDGAYQHRALTDGPKVQRFWHQSKLNLLGWFFSVDAGDRVLDVGCGSGVFANAMASRGADVTGVDASEDAVNYAKRTFGRPGLAFHRGYLDELRFPQASFDKATCLEVVEHVYLHQAQQLIADLHGLLVPGGRLLITTPNYRGLWPAVEWCVDHFSSAAKMAVDQHITHFDRKRITAIIEQAGFIIEDARTYSTFAPFCAAVSWSLAERVEGLERKLNIPFGNVLAIVARKT